MATEQPREQRQEGYARGDMVTIRQAAQLTGVPEHTLRAWERRYGSFRTARTAGGYRLYDAEALARVRAMKQLVASGRPPREAAAEVARRLPHSHGKEPHDAAQHLVEALKSMDAATAKRLIDEQFALRSYEAVVDDWLMPTLVRVGDAWANGDISVAAEHLAANIVMRRLAAAFDAVGPNPRTPPAIIGAPSGITHELGLMAFAVALRRAGAATIYLGADVPAQAWSEAVGTTGAAISITAIPRRSDARRVAALVTQLESDHPEVPICVGGRFQELAPAGTRQLGHGIAAAARELAAGLAGGRPSAATA